MQYDRPIADREVGRNAQLFAQAVARQKETPAARYPHLRILVSLIEQAHPEWEKLPDSDRRIAQLAHRLSGGALDEDEVAAAARDAE